MLYPQFPQAYPQKKH